MKKRLIDANALMDEFRRYLAKRFDRERCVSEENCNSCERECLWRKTVKNAPTVEAVEVVHGRWIRKHLLGCEPFYLCSICEKLHDQDYNFCNNCGAKMDGDDHAKEQTSESL